MPIGETEYHPYLESGYTPFADKLILGTFPVYECTLPDNPLKESLRLKNKSSLFFYGSGSSEFWNLYRKYVDEKAGNSAEEILANLSKHQISISDLILKCERREYSPSDGNLLEVHWNITQIKTYLDEGVAKILCTSKETLKLLRKHVLNDYVAKLEKSQLLQNIILEDLGGISEKVKTPFLVIFEKDNKSVCAMAIPSPGSIQRKLQTFGRGNCTSQEYADKYLKMAFTWFLNGI